jgi:hypothetical protein
VAQQSPIVTHGDVREAMELLRTNFRTHEHAGPAKYARFELSNPADIDERDRLRRYAQGTVAEFLSRWDAAAGHG